MTEKRYYKVGGHVIEVELAEPWHFKALSPKEAEVAEKLRAGEDLGVIPVPADKLEDLALNREITGKDAIKGDRYGLDFSQYAPFEVAESAPLMTLRVQYERPGWLVKAEEEKAWRQVVRVDEVPPFYEGRVLDGRIIYEFYPAEDVSAGIFVIEEDYKTGTYYPREKMGPRVTMFQVNTVLMILYTFAAAPYNTLLLHSSMVRLDGKANLFFGVSGTGKSTHSRLWLEHVKGCDLMNDDNPIIRFDDRGTLIGYGSPWSGKTLCYRNVSAPVRALVRLEQAPENRINRLFTLDAYASVVAASSTIRWNRRIMDALIPTVERVAMTVPCYHLGCRPDAEAVEVCKNCINES